MIKLQSLSRLPRFSSSLYYVTSKKFSYEVLYQGRNISLIPPEHKRTLIWLQGLGGSALDWISFFRDESAFKLVSPETTKITLLSAPIKEISIYRDLPTAAWYNVCHIQGNDVHCESDVQESSALIQKQLREEAKFFNGEYSQIALGGFSQGCAMALAVAHKFPHTIAGVCGFSGVLLNFVELDENKKSLPTFLYHGEADEVIPARVALKSYRRLQEGGYNVTVMTEDGLGHTISQRGLESAQRFLSNILE